jgi:hemerythrin-like domain-containing protein
MNKMVIENTDRRSFFKKAGILITGAAVASPWFCLDLARSEEKKGETNKIEVSPPEDLMREHGVLRRILLIYEDIQDKLNGGREFPAEVLAGATGTVQKFIEQYHEKLEENYLFPRFKKAGKLVELVTVLKKQHEAGRRLTPRVMQLASPAALKEAPKRRELADTLHLFTRMYRPHAAREDTILFPALRTIVSKKEFDDLGEEFEDKEEKLFGEGGFEKVVAHVAELEKTLGIYELAQFTPPK